jgi:hypothetical protein
MAAIDFPASPTVGQTFAAGNGTTYQWTGTLWIAVASSSQAPYVGDTPPASPLPNTLWWNSTLGSLYIWYNDGNTTQWVPTSPAPAAPAPPVPSTGVLTLYSEKVCVGGETFMDVTIPSVASLKRLELEYSQRCATAADPTMTMQILESGVPNATSNYSNGYIYQNGTTVAGNGVNSVTSWPFSGGRQSVGQVLLYVIPSGYWYATHSQYLITQTTRYLQQFVYDFPPANIALTTGFRLSLASASFQAGSYFRAFVVI